MKRPLVWFGAIFWLFSAISTPASTLYVDLNSTNATPPFSNWSTAATNIQDAIEASNDGDQIWVTNGLYQTGGKVIAGNLTNRVALTKAVTVQSVNGPLVTTIAGIGGSYSTNAVRCAWLTNNATLSGFTLTRGATRPSGFDVTTMGSGGAVWCASSNSVLTGCIIISNVSFFHGAGAYQGSLINCYISGNSDPVNFVGGAAFGAILNNCTVVSNSMVGLTSCQATNSICYYNSGTYSSSSFAYSCVTPTAAGTGNFTNAPQFFEDRIHLLPGSSCVGAGTTPVTSGDLFGKTWGTPPSVGCAEAASLNQPMLQSACVASNAFQFSFAAQYGVNYTVQYATNLSPPVTWQTQQSVLFAPAGVLTIQDQSIADSARFYRVQAQ